MANRIPLIVDSTAKQIQELPDGDNLVLSGELKLTGTSAGTTSDIHLSGGSDSVAVIGVTSTTGTLSRLRIDCQKNDDSGDMQVAHFQVGSSNIPQSKIFGEFTIGSGETVDIIRDEDDLSSDDPNALATQQSIKAYVDNFGRVKQIREATSTAESTFDTTTFTNKVSLTVSNIANDSRMLIIASYRLRSATPFTSGRDSQGRCIKDGGSFEGEEIINEHNGSGKDFVNILYDSANGAGSRTYRIQARREQQQAVIISNAKILAIELAISS